MNIQDIIGYVESSKVATILAIVLAIIAAALVADFITSRILRALARHKKHARTGVAALERIVRWTTRVVAAVAVAGAFGLEFGGIWTFVSAALATIAIGFVAVWSLLSNPTSTLLILFLQPFQIDDEVEFPGEPIKGRVSDINFFYTTLRADDGALFQVPNALFFQKTMKRREGSAPHSLEEQLKSPDPAPEAPMKKQEPNPLMSIPDPATIFPKSHI